MAAKVSYTSSTEGIDWTEVANIMVTVGWGHREPERLMQAFKTSSFTRFAFVQEHLVGLGRTVDDGMFYAMIVDLAVLPQFQGQGIGSTILTELRDELASFSFTTLTAAIGKEGFYEKQGWCKQRTAFIWPRSEEQINAHTEDAD